MKRKTRKKVALVLGSGGARGLAHVPIVRGVVSMGVPVDMVVGASMGAVVGLAYCAGRLDEFEEELMKLYRTDQIYSMSRFVVSASGLTDIDHFVKRMKALIHPYTRIEELPVPLGVVCTDYYSGRAVAFTAGDIITAVRGSVSVPGALVPIRYGDTLLIDGGTANAVPVDVAKKLGADLTIAVDVNPIHLLNRESVLRLPARTPINESVIRGLKDGLIPAHPIPAKEVNFRDIRLAEIRREVPEAIGWLRRTLRRLLGVYLRIFRNKEKDIRRKGILFPRKRSGIPNIVEILWQTIDIMQAQNTCAMFEKYAPDVLIEPDVIRLFPIDFTQIPLVFRAGTEAFNRKRKLIRERILSRL